jgi:hypothetical protein
VSATNNETENTKDADVDVPEAGVDPNVDRAPGGADATPNESDVGGGDRTDGGAITPDPPLSAQQDESTIPDPIQEPEEKEQANEDAAERSEDEPAD